MARGRPSRRAVFAALDNALRDLWAVGGLPLPQELEGIWEGIWHEETHHSTAIEGNTLVLKQVRALLNDQRAVGNKDFREYLEIQGYADAARWVYAEAIQDRLRVQEDDGDVRPMIALREVREIHRRVIGPEWEFLPPDGLPRDETPGDFRECEVNALSSGLRPPIHTMIHADLSNWIASANDELPDDTHLMEKLAGLHAAFERIHPFRDGNGRVGRLAINLMLVRYGYPWAIIYKRDRTKYLDALESADGGNNGPLAELLARSVRHSIERFLIPNLAGDQRLVPIASLATEHLSHVALLSAARRQRLRATRYAEGWYSTRRWVDEYCASRHPGKRAA